MTSRTPTDVDPSLMRSFKRTNLIAAALHAAQAIAMLALSNARSLPVTAAFASGPPGQSRPSQVELLFTYRIGPAVALFSALSSIAHLVVASPWGFPRYQRELAQERNRFRWVEYSISSTLMIVVIAGITGMTDIGALIGIAGSNAAMILFGWLMETTTAARPARSWAPFVFGSILGAVPWLAVLVYLVGAGGGVPGFVYGIYVTMFIAFNCFAAVQLLQYRGRGKWADYLTGERWYVGLSFVAKSLLAWQVFANVLVP